MSAAGMRQNNIAETLIGAAVVAVALAFLAFTYMRTGTGSLSSGYELNARLPKVDGLGIGTDVRLAGVKIGKVTDLALDPKTYLDTVHMNISDDIKIPADSSVLVTSAGLMGSQYQTITPGGDDKLHAAGGQAVGAGFLARRAVGGGPGRRALKRSVIALVAVAGTGAALAHSVSI